MYTVSIEIEGIAPGLLMNRFPEATQAGLKNPVKLAARAKPTPEQEAEGGAYRMDTGQLCQPAEHIYQALVKAASEFQIQGRGKQTYRDRVKGLVIIRPELICHERSEYEIDARPVRVQRARVVRHRPHLPEWRLAFDAQVLDGELLEPAVLNAILLKAGQSVGIGDYRPRFGRFVVTRFETMR